VPLRSVPQVINAVERGELDLGLVPLENSIEGSVSVTLDTLAFEATSVTIAGEHDHPIANSLIARTDLPGRHWLEFGFWVAVFLPSLTVVVGWILLFDGYNGLANKALEMLPFGFRPGTKEFEELLRDCPLQDIVYKFRQLETLTPRGLRAEDVPPCAVWRARNAGLYSPRPHLAADDPASFG
jgi:hypothetical protein